MFFFVVMVELLFIFYRELEFDKEMEMEWFIMIYYFVGLYKDFFVFFYKGIVCVCCNVLYSLRCFKEVVEGF